MTPIRINIPNKADCAPYPDFATQQAAGAIVMQALREGGMCPFKAGMNPPPLLRACLGMWGRGEIDRAGFVRCVRNLVVVNPGL